MVTVDHGSRFAENFPPFTVRPKASHEDIIEPSMKLEVL